MVELRVLSISKGMIALVEDRHCTSVQGKTKTPWFPRAGRGIYDFIALLSNDKSWSLG